MASAFAGDPVFNWLIAKEVEERSRMVFEGSLAAEFAKPSHIVDVAEASGSVRAAAVWHEVDDWKGADPPLRVLLPRLYAIFGLRMIRAMRLLPMMAAAHPSEPHRYLGFIGVHADQRGTGLGGALLTSMTNECDEMGIPAYLESSNPVNNALYHRFGFESTGLIPLPKGAPPVMAMWRRPR